MKFKKPNKQTVWTQTRLLTKQQSGLGLLKLSLVKVKIAEEDINQTYFHLAIKVTPSYQHLSECQDFS